MQTTSADYEPHIMNRVCTLRTSEGGLQSQHDAEEDAVNWL